MSKKDKSIVKVFVMSTVVILLFFVVALFLVSKFGASKPVVSSDARLEDGKQIVEVTAHGGYSPGIIKAQADTETVLKITSDNAFGCERALSIRQLGITKILPINGETEIELGKQEPGSNIIGSCSMGMYSFEINFN